MDKNINKEIRNTIKCGDFDSFKRLIDNNPDSLNVMTPFGTWLHIAAKRGYLKMVRYLVEKGLDVNIKGGIFDATAMNLAALSGEMNVIRYLVSKGAILDVSHAKRNPLFSAIQDGHMDVVQYLVEQGIDITVRYNSESLNNIGAYEFAIEYGQTEIAEYLKEKLEQ